MTTEREDAVVAGPLHVAGKECDKCRQERSPLHGRLVWIDGRGASLVRICQVCFDEITVATEKKMAEIKVSKTLHES